MILNINFQINLFIFSLLSGIMIGIFFDLYRTIRGVNTPGNIVTIVQDLLFWLLISTIVFIFLLYTNYAYVSIYVYLLIFLALGLYLRFFSKYVSYVVTNIFSYVYKVIRFTVKNIYFVVELFFNRINKLFIHK